MTQEFSKQFREINNIRMAYVDRGTGRPMLFLHGNPTSSFLWRNILGPLSSEYRCLAPDLVGMGDSDKLPGNDPERYSFAEQQRYLDGFIESLQLDQPVILVIHDWGSALGFDFARRYPKRVRGIAYMEAITGIRSWEAMPPQARELFQALRSAAGEQMILEQNAFIERLLPLSILRPLTAEEHDEYRRPFRVPGEGRRPTLSWPRQLPIAGEPRQICDLVERYAAFMAASAMPKLFINAEPGRLLTGELREACRRWPNQTEVTVSGLHYIQEDSPTEITNAIRDWARTLP